MRKKQRTQPFMNETVLEDLSSSCYLSSSINNNGGSNADTIKCINCPQQSFGLLCPVLKASHISRKTNIRLFNSNVKSTQLYGRETRNAVPSDINAIQLNSNFRMILKTGWPTLVTNYVLRTTTNREPMGTKILKRKWNW